MTPPVPPGVYGELAQIVTRYATGGAEPASPREGLFFTRRDEPSQPLHVAQRPSFWLVVQGRKCLSIGDEELHYGVGDCLLVALDLPVTSRITLASPAEPHLCVGMAINPTSLAELVSRAPTPAPIPAFSQCRRGVAVHAAPPELLDAMLRLLRLLDRPADLAAMGPLIEQEILWRLLNGPDGARLLRVAMGEGQGGRVSRAVAWLRNNFAEPLRIEALAERVGMSESSLHHHFKAVTNMTPMQYQKQLRLYEARRLMLAEGLDVGAAGFSVGYQSPSQFSREYRRLYGLSPARDIEALRAPMAAE